MKNKPKIIVILGQTATGKSGLAVRLAKKFKGEVVSADSRQIYKGLNIATGKISRREMSGVSHHMLSVVSPQKIYSVSDWQKRTKEIIGGIIAGGKLPIICGGTGFYIQSIVNNTVLPEVPPNKKLRRKLKNKTAAELCKILKKLDPKIIKTIDTKNPVRLIRAIEIAARLGTVPKLQKNKADYEILQIGLKLPEKLLRKKIHDRVLSRIKKGMFKEARKLQADGLTLKRMRALGLEYRLLADFLQKKITPKNFVMQLDLADWHYARRQFQWFKRDKNIQWFSPTTGKKIEKTVKNFLNK